VTLEVRVDNAIARSLNETRGFSAGGVPYEFWTKPLDATP